MTPESEERRNPPLNDQRRSPSGTRMLDPGCFGASTWVHVFPASVDTARAPRRPLPSRVARFEPAPSPGRGERNPVGDTSPGLAPVRGIEHALPSKIMDPVRIARIGVDAADVAYEREALGAHDFGGDRTIWSPSLQAYARPPCPQQARGHRLPTVHRVTPAVGGDEEAAARAVAREREQRVRRANDTSPYTPVPGGAAVRLRTSVFPPSNVRAIP